MSFINTQTMRSQTLLEQLKLIGDETPVSTYEEAQELFSKLNKTRVESDGLLSELENLRDTIVETGGLTRDLADDLVTVAGESVLSRSIRSTLTARPTARFAEDALVAVEALSEKIKIGLIMAIVGIVLKILGWLLGRSSSTTGQELETLARTVKERVLASDEADRVHLDAYFTDVAKDAFVRVKKRLIEEKRYDRIEHASLGANITTLDTLLSAYELSRSSATSLATPGVVELLVANGKDVVVDTIMAFIDNPKYPGNRILSGEITKEEWETELLRAIILTNVGVTILPTPKNLAEREYLNTAWYADGFDKPGTGNDAWYKACPWVLTGCRVFTEQAFKIFNDSVHKQYLDRIMIGLGVLNDKVVEFFDNELRGDANKAPWGVEEFADTLPDAVNPSKMNSEWAFPSIKQAPLLWFDIKMFLDKMNKEFNFHDSFNRFDTSPVLEKGYRAPVAVIDHLVALGGIGDQRVTMLYSDRLIIGSFMDSKPEYDKYYEATHTRLKLDNIARFSTADVTYDEMVGDDVGANWDGPSFWIPNTNVMPDSSLAPEVDKWSDEQRENMIKGFATFRLVGEGGGKMLKDFDPNKHDRMYKHLEKTVRKVRDTLSRLEKLATSNKWSRNDTVGGISQIKRGLNKIDPKYLRYTYTIAYMVTRNIPFTNTWDFENLNRDLQHQNYVYNTWTYYRAYLEMAENMAKFGAAAKALADKANRSPLIKK